jgi:hypothetical protein
VEGLRPSTPPLKVVLPWLSDFVSPELSKIDFRAHKTITTDLCKNAQRNKNLKAASHS